MVVHLLRSSEMRTVYLPAIINGHHPISVTLAHGGKEVLLTIAASEGHWVLQLNENIIQDAEQINGSILREESSFFLCRTNHERMLLYCTRDLPTGGLFRYYTLSENQHIYIGSHENCQIRYQNDLINDHVLSVYRKGHSYYVESTESASEHMLFMGYVNDMMVSRQLVVGIGGCIKLLSMKILLGPGFVAVNIIPGAVKISLPEYIVPAMNVLSENQRLAILGNDNLLFSSAPRAYYQETRKSIVVEEPPQIPENDELPWYVMAGPSLTMSIGSLMASMMTISNMMASGSPLSSVLPSLLMSLTMVMGMAVWPGISRSMQNKQRTARQLSADMDYMNYLHWLKAEINRLAMQQVHNANQNNPSLEECISTIFRMQPSLWERSERHDDFLDVMVGRGSLPLHVDFSYPKRTHSSKVSESARAMYKIMEQEYSVENIPITIPFKQSGVVGVIGQRWEVLNFTKALIIELTTLHNYQDLRLVFIYDESEKDTWKFTKWVPHVWDQAVDFRCIASTFSEMKRLNDYLSGRIQKGERETGDKTHYIIVAASKVLAERSPVLTSIYDPAFCNNMTVISLYNHKKYLPKECRYVIELLDNYKATILDFDNISGKVQFCDSYISCVDDPESLFVKMSNIQLGGLERTSELPTQYSFAEMCEVGRMEQIDLIKQWNSADSVNSLKAQIGIDSNGYPIFLDVHEKAHGPHGLIAGMTGSGKSEFIISYIASMAINYSPEDVAFVLIDFKGGGMADIFKDLPHTAGLITNLDGNELKRSFIAIESELQKRQRLFKEISEQKKISNIDIYKYQNLRRSDPSLKPLPHLVLISDEFAELKQQHRDFMEQLVRIARIGRSLGVHLILATQKPDGVVDDQINSNVRFRVCLKVQDRIDSKTMIGRPDAANITNPGRFFFLVGNEEIFEFGQSPWSGATYIPSDSLVRNIGTEITVLDHQGCPILRQSLRQERKIGSAPEKQIDALVEYIGNVARSVHKSAEKLWLQPLAGPAETKTHMAKQANIHDPFVLAPVVGMYDDLENQKHLPLSIPISNGGNTLLYGAAGTGALEFINAMLMNLLETHGPEELNLYLVDYEAGALAAFNKAPHTKNYASATGVGDAKKLIDEVSSILQQRKHELQEYGGDFHNYIRTSGKTMPNVMLVVMNFQNLSEAYMDIRNDISSLARQGTQYGVYVFLSGNSIPYTLQPLFHNIFTLQQNSEDQYREILGKTGGITPAAFRGRGITRINGSVCEFQTNIVFQDSENTFHDINNFCLGLRGNEPVPMQEVKDAHYTWNDLNALSLPVTAESLPVAYNQKTHKVDYLSLYDQVSTLVLYDAAAKCNYQAFLKLLRNTGISLNYLGTDNSMLHLSGWDAIRPSQFSNEITALWSEMLMRAKSAQEAQSNNTPTPDFAHLIYVIDNVSTVLEWLEDDARMKLVSLIAGLTPGYHIHFVLLDEATNAPTLVGATCLKRGIPFRQGLLLSSDPLCGVFFGADQSQYEEIGPSIYINGQARSAQILELGEEESL